MPVEDPTSLVVAVGEFKSDGVEELVVIQDVGGETGVVGGVAVLGLGEGVDVEMFEGMVGGISGVGE